MTPYLEMCAGIGSQMHKFLLAHGKSFETTEHSWDGVRREQGMCFMNASHLALENHNYIYCEGLVSVYGVAIDHAWVIDQSGYVIDPTLTKTPIRIGEYFGVAFDTKYLAKCLRRNKYYGLLGWPYAKKTVEPLFAGKTKNFKAKIGEKA